jgi:transcriptional regulator with XRE-family HTH domain
VRQRFRQRDVGRLAGLSPQVVSRIERGRVDEVSIRSLRAVARVLGIRLDLVARWRGGELDRLVNSRHAALHEALLRWLKDEPDWEVASEVSYSVYGERGVVDFVAWHRVRRALIIGELKSEFVDPNELVGTMDRRRRLAAQIVKDRGWVPLIIAVWVVVDDQRTNRRQLARHRELLRGAFPMDGRTIRRWLRSPSGPIAALSFLPNVRHTHSRHRVRQAQARGHATATARRKP